MKSERIYNKHGEHIYTKFCGVNTTYYVRPGNVSSFVDHHLSRLQYDIADFVVDEGCVVKNRYGTTEDLVEAFITLNYD